ncbi:hypothetical protein T484DRAFT_2464210 [Baffinella frigidus]|nr:hypothetical protein T484DRAFT_2464210 [Cryptophyta sp. CCMP2293]
MGLKHHGTQVEFVTHYLDFLTTFNDDNNTRVVFEKVLSEDNGLDKQQALVIWDRFWDFEVSRGDLGAIHKIEKRRAALYPESRSASSLARLAHRYRVQDLWPCGDSQLQLMNVDPNEGSLPHSSSATKKSDSGGGGGRGDRERGSGDGGKGGGGGGEGRPVNVVVQGKDVIVEPKRPSVPLPPIPKPLQDFLDMLPNGPVANPPNPDEILSMIHQMIIPGRFYKPPTTMSVTGSLIPGSAPVPPPPPPGRPPGSGAPGTGGGGVSEGTGRGGGKRGRDEAPGAGGDVFRNRQKQRFANITD